MDLKTAYDILDIKKNCTLQELHTTFERLIKKEQSFTTLEEVKKAYQVVYTHLTNQAPIFNHSQPPKARLANFFYHYKYHVIFTIIALILAGSFLYTIIGNKIDRAKDAKQPPVALELMLFGDYEEEDFTALEQKLLNMFPEWDSISTILVYSPTEVDTEEKMAAVQKNQVIIQQEEPDIYIFDLYHFHKFIDNAPLLPLDELKNKANKKEEVFKTHQKETDDHEHIYGVDLTNHPLFSGLQIEDKEKIAVIRTEATNKDNAWLFLSQLLN